MDRGRMESMTIRCHRCGGTFGTEPFQRDGLLVCPHCNATVPMPPPGAEFGGSHSFPGREVVPPPVSAPLLGPAPRSVGSEPPIQRPPRDPLAPPPPLRPLSAKEKSRRRLARNVIMWCVGASVLVLAASILMRLR